MHILTRRFELRYFFALYRLYSSDDTQIIGQAIPVPAELFIAIITFIIRYMPFISQKLGYHMGCVIKRYKRTFLDIVLTAKYANIRESRLVFTVLIVLPLHGLSSLARMLMLQLTC